MGSSNKEVPFPAPAVPVNEPLFSIRNYVLAARAKNISGNWPFPETYLQNCMIHRVSKVLPPFDSYKSVKNIVYRKEENSHYVKDGKSDTVSIRKNYVGLDRGKEIIEVNCSASTSNTNPRSNEEMDEQCLTAMATCSNRLNSNGQRENLICVKDVKPDIASVQKNYVDHDCEGEMIEVNGNVSTSNSNPRSNIEEEEKCIRVKDMKLGTGAVQKNCVGSDREEEIIEANDNISTSNSNPGSNVEENSSGVSDMKSDIGSVQTHCVGLNRREAIIEVNGDLSATSDANPKSDEEENSDCVKDNKFDTCSMQKNCVGRDREEAIEVNDIVSTSNSNPRSNVEDSSGVNDMKSDIGSVQKLHVRLNSREEIIEVNGDVSATSNSNPKSNEEETSDGVKDDKSDTGAVTVIKVNGSVSTSNSITRFDVEENSSCVKDMESHIGSIQKYHVGVDRREETFEVNGVVSATSDSNMKSNKDQSSDSIKDDKSDTGAVTSVGLDYKETIEANGNVSTSNPKSGEEGNSSCVKENKSDTGAINSVGVDHEEEIIEANINASTSNSNPWSNEEENSDIGSVQKDCKGFNREEEIIEVNRNASTTSNLNPKIGEMNEQHLKAEASCSKRLNSKWKKRKRKAKKRLVADVVADAKPYTLEELDKINGSNWAIDQHVIYRRMTSRNQEVEVNETKETTVNDILGTRSSERFQKTKQHRKDNNTAENDSIAVEKKPAHVIKFKPRKAQSPDLEVNTPIKSDSKSKSVVAKSQVKRSLPSVSGVSTVIRKKGRRGNP
ncbi:hypothetical protein MKW94_002965 [Papaver nudicaule]|uniref:Uncharacterized protein n=1 Tax=Papaver nudicaule TaxID=74823 RepID=A0AA41W0S0_PAPNU|nr:hypothetical protein [Papaver nudicaule]